jgi:uncharacterized protein (TIGR02217 family)
MRAAEIEMRGVASGPNLATGGAAFASSRFSASFDPSFAFDGSTSGNSWASSSWTAGIDYIGYQFASPVEINEIAYASAEGTKAATLFVVESSDDNFVYTAEWWGFFQGWVSGTLHRFTRPAILVDAARYWGIVVTEGINFNDIVIGDIEMRDAPGGTDLTGGGTPFYAPSREAAANAYDHNPSTIVYTNTTVQRAIFYYDFGSGLDVAIQEIAIIKTGGSADHAPKSGFALRSEDGIAWEEVGLFSNFTWPTATSLVEISITPPPIITGAVATQMEILSLELGTPDARATQLLAIVLEKLPTTSQAQMTPAEVLILEKPINDAWTTQMQAIVLERLTEEDPIEWQDRGIRRSRAEHAPRRFIDLRAPPDIGEYPCNASPRWSDRVTTADSGDTLVTARWAHPLYRFTLPEAIRTQDTLEAVRDHWLIMHGPAFTWPFANPLDFASCALTDDRQAFISPNDQIIGVGTGYATRFQLIKRYARGSQHYDRPITLPIPETVKVSVGGVPWPHQHYTVSRRGGVVVFDRPPGVGQIIRAGFLFEHEVRFDGDDGFEAIQQSFAASGYGALTLIEVPDTAP